MKRNKYVKPFLQLAQALMLTTSLLSCASFLEEDPSHIGTADTYYVTKDGLDNGVNACYASLRETHSDKTLWLMGTDIYSTPGLPIKSGIYNGLNEYDRQKYNPDNGTFSSFWTRMYKAISTCNTLLQQGVRAEVDKDYVDMRLAEVKVLRALYYSYLVEQFGDIPFPLEPILGVQTVVTMVPEATIYETLIADVEDALKYLPETSENFGRVTSGVANTLLAKLYLTRGYKNYAHSEDFVNAAAAADRVISSGVYNLLSNFGDIFKPGNEENSEIIFSVQYSENLSSNGDGNNMHTFFGIKYDKFPGMGRSTVYNRRVDTFGETPFLLHLFEYNGDYKTDKRFDGTFLRVYYADEDKTYTGKVGATDQSKEYTIVKGDTAIYIPYPNEPFSQQKVDDVNYLLVYGDFYLHYLYSEEDYGDKFWYGNYENARPANNKFWEPGAYSEGLGVRDLFIYRLADVYLLAAEAYYKAGEIDKAVERINVVRRRACGSDINVPSIMDVTAEQVNIDFILDERARELCGEDNRWCDLKRTGKLVERVTEHNEFVKWTKKLKEYHTLRPYPNSWLERLDNRDEIQQHEY